MVNRNDSTKIFNYQFWLVNDEELAMEMGRWEYGKMGINTDVENVGDLYDLYVLRK